MPINQIISPLTAPLKATEVDASSPSSIASFVASNEAFNATLADIATDELNTAFSEVNTVEADINTKAAEIELQYLATLGAANYRGDYNALTIYSRGQSVSFTDGFMYVSKVDSNTGNNPSTETTKWLKLWNSGRYLVASGTGESITLPMSFTDPTIDKYVLEYRTGIAPTSRTLLVRMSENGTAVTTGVYNGNTSVGFTGTVSTTTSFSLESLSAEDVSVGRIEITLNEVAQFITVETSTTHYDVGAAVNPKVLRGFAVGAGVYSSPSGISAIDGVYMYTGITDSVYRLYAIRK